MIHRVSGHILEVAIARAIIFEEAACVLSLAVFESSWLWPFRTSSADLGMNRSISSFLAVTTREIRGQKIPISGSIYLTYPPCCCAQISLLELREYSCLAVLS